MSWSIKRKLPWPCPSRLLWKSRRSHGVPAQGLSAASQKRKLSFQNARWSRCSKRCWNSLRCKGFPVFTARNSDISYILYPRMGKVYQKHPVPSAWRYCVETGQPISLKFSQGLWKRKVTKEAPIMKAILPHPRQGLLQGRSRCSQTVSGGILGLYQKSAG